MREILFRGKRKDNGEWFYGNLVYMTEGYDEPQAVISPSTTYISNGDIWGDFWFVIPETVGQWTGLVDKNGVKIFEGDIVECLSWNEFFSDGSGKPLEAFRRKMLVVFNEGAFRMKEDFPLGLKSNYWDLIYDGDIVIIGNIHDNPELLKGEEE